MTLGCFINLDLWIIFLLGATIAWIVAPQVPAFDTSHLIENHTGDVAQLVHLPSLRWDALHYLEVAMHGTYTYEHQYAFSPGVPLVLRFVQCAKFYALSPLRQGAAYFMSNFQTSRKYSLIIEAFNSLLVASLAIQPCLGIYRLANPVDIQIDS
jgi:hypothetical protein